MHGGKHLSLLRLDQTTWQVEMVEDYPYETRKVAGWAIVCCPATPVEVRMQITRKI